MMQRIIRGVGAIVVGLVLSAGSLIVPMLQLAQSGGISEVFAQSGTTGPGTGTQGEVGPGTGTRGVTGGSAKLENPLGNTTSVSEFVKKILNGLIQIGIPIAVLFVIYAGFKFVTAQGNSEKLAEARKNFLWTIVGIAIFLGAVVIADLVAGTLRQIGAKV